MSKKVLVVGGAGYIGAHSCLLLAERGYDPIVFDNLSNGHSEFVQWGPLEIGDIRDRARLDAVLAKHQPDAVVHFAALIEVADPCGSCAIGQPRLQAERCVERRNELKRGRAR